MVVTDDDEPCRHDAEPAEPGPGRTTARGSATCASATTTGSTRCQPPSGVAQLERLAELRAGRARVAAAYERASRCRLDHPAAAGAGESVDWFVYVVRLRSDIDRDEVMPSLAEHGVPSATVLLADPPATVLSLDVRVQARRLPGHGAGRRVDPRAPFSSRLTDDEVGYVAEALGEVVDGHGGGRSNR